MHATDLEAQTLHKHRKRGLATSRPTAVGQKGCIGELRDVDELLLARHRDAEASGTSTSQWQHRRGCGGEGEGQILASALDVPRVVVASSHDDQVFDTATHEQLALMEEPEVSRAQEASNAAIATTIVSCGEGEYAVEVLCRQVGQTPVPLQTNKQTNKQHT